MTHKLVQVFLILPILIFSLGELPRESSLHASQAAAYTWQLVRWSDGLPLCLLEINHEGLPTGAEIYAQCGAERYQNWLNTPPCIAASAGGDTSTCTGVYLRLISVSQTAGQGQESSPASDTHEIPPPEAWLNIQGCEFRDQSYICSQPPILEIQANGISWLPGMMQRLTPSTSRWIMGLWIQSVIQLACSMAVRHSPSGARSTARSTSWRVEPIPSLSGTEFSAPMSACSYLTTLQDWIIPSMNPRQS